MQNSPPSTQEKQQWEMLASPGHVLLAQVEVYKHKTKVPWYFIIGAMALALFSFVVTPFVSAGAGKLAGWATQAVSSALAVKPLESTPAPQLNQFRPVLQGYFATSLVEFPKIEVVHTAMQAQVLAMTAEKLMEDCDFAKKINESWFDGVDSTPKCRYSTDKTRLWVWAIANNGGVNQPWAGLILKMNGKVSLFNVDSQGISKIKGVNSIRPELIPRAIAADFPELTF